MNEADNKSQTTVFFTERTGKLLTILGLVFVIVTALIFVVFSDWKFSWHIDEEKIAQFGDFIGGIIGSMFSLAGVILFYVALKEQRKDININQKNLELQNIALNQQVEEFKAQKKELIETRKIYEEQTTLIREQTNLYKQQNKELKDQTNIAKLQQFDSSFFSYINILVNLKNTLDFKNQNPNYFDSIYLKIKIDIPQEKSLNESFSMIQEKYINIFQEYKNELSQYFKTLYRIIVLIDSSSLDDDKKHQYFKLLRSQLTDSELLILYYNYHSFLGVNVRPYVIKYSLLKHIRILDRVEMDSDLNGHTKFEFELFLSKIGNYITSGFEKFKSLEELNDVDLSTNLLLFNMKTEITLKITSELFFSIKFTEIEFQAQAIITKEIFKKLVSRQIYSVLFLEKFKMPEGNEITISTTECSPYLEFNFKIEEIQNI